MTIGTGETWYNRRQKALEKCIVPLSSSSYKGSSGRVGILGGSERYTGAPFYAAMGSLKCGADLAFCFCAEEAALPLKSYSPELMVTPVYEAAQFEKALCSQRQDSSSGALDKTAVATTTNELLVEQMVEKVCSMMEKMHVMVLGPGLGRCPLVLEATARIIKKSTIAASPTAGDRRRCLVFVDPAQIPNPVVGPVYSSSHSECHGTQTTQRQ